MNEIIAITVIISSLGSMVASVSIVRWLKRLDRNNRTG